jgi:hypothetical protein
MIIQFAVGVTTHCSQVAKLPELFAQVLIEKSVSPKAVKHPFEPRTGRRLGSYPLARCFSLNSTNGILQHRTLMVKVCFVKRTLAKLVRLHGACAIVDGAPVFESICL